MHRGYIRLWRKLNDWEWISDPNVVLVFIHLLLDINFKDKKWHGIDIPRGSVLVGRKSLAKKVGLSEQSIRTALTKLKSTNEITIKSTNKYSLISINNYNLYQQTTNNTTNDQPAINQQSTTTNNVNKEKNTNTKVLVAKAEPQKDIYVEIVLTEFGNSFGFRPTDRKPRFVAYNFSRNLKSFLKIFNPDITEARFTKVIKTYLSWLLTQDYSNKIETLDAVKRKFPIWADPQVLNYQKGRNATSNQ